MTPPSNSTPENTPLSYEAARDELRQIVQALEMGSAPLEETLNLWQRGEELVKYCQNILLSAQQKVAAAAEVTSQTEANRQKERAQ